MATIDEVYSAYGRTVRTAQQLEGLLTMCLTLLESLPGTSADRFIREAPLRDQLYEKIKEFVESKTLGAVLKMFSKHDVFDDSEEAKLRLALGTRNRLAHGFFARNEELLEDGKGRTKVVEDLNEQAVLFLEVSQFVISEIPDRAQAESANKLIRHGVPVNVLRDFKLKR